MKSKTISKKIMVRDLLVVGMGDSFGAGVGNPDVPADMSDQEALNQTPVPTGARTWGYERNSALNDGSSNSQLIYVPGRPAATEVARRNAAAQWVDRNCHRSLYSPQMRAALQIALNDSKQQTAVTYLGYACDGARLEDGILQRYPGNENVKTQKLARERSQFDKLVRDLCGMNFSRARTGNFVICTDEKTRRPIDLMLLSIGGNDVGFAPLVSYATVDSNSGAGKLAISKLKSGCNTGKDKPSALTCAYHDVAKARERMERLDKLFPELNRRFRLANLQFSNNEAGKKPIVLTEYPKIHFDQNGNLCPTDRAGMTISPILGVDRNKLAELDKFVGELANKIRILAYNNGWSTAYTHVAAFHRHGFCAKGNNAADHFDLPFRYSNTAGGVAYAQDFWRNFLGKTGSPFGDPGFLLWQIFDAQTMRPYSFRKRWVRTFNDAYWIVNFVNGIDIRLPTDNGMLDFVQTAIRGLGGPMHPTAEGFAVIADSTLKKACEIAPHLNCANLATK